MARSFSKDLIGITHFKSLLLTILLVDPLLSTVSMPIITKQPEDKDLSLSATTSLTVDAAGSMPLTFQWYLVQPWSAASAIIGATNATYTASAVRGILQVFVRVSDPSGSIDSRTASVVVEPSMSFEVAARWSVTNGYGFDVTIVGHTAYLANGNDGLEVFDVSDLEHPVQIGRYDFGTSAYIISVQGDFIYVATETGTYELPLGSSFPPKPTMKLGTSGGRVKIVGTLAYVAGDAGLDIFDISDRSHVVKMSHYYDPYAWGFDVSLNYVFLADGGGQLNVLDAADPTKIIRVGGFDLGPHHASEIQIKGSYAFVAAEGLSVFDVRNPAQIQRLALIGVADRIAVSGNTAFTVGYHGTYQMQAFRIDNPMQPILAGSYASTEEMRGVFATNKNVYLAAGPSGLKVFRIPDGPPAITQQPEDRVVTAYEGGQEAAYLGVVASGRLPMNYQWFIGTNGDISHPLDGAIGDIYVAFPVTLPGDYWVRVSNTAGFADSRTANIIVRPSFRAVQTTNGFLSIRLFGVAGTSWDIQQSTDLKSWGTATPPIRVTLDKGSALIPLLLDGTKEKFFRAVTVLP